MLVAVQRVVHVLRPPVLDEMLDAEVLPFDIEIVALVRELTIEDGPEVVLVLHAVVCQQALEESVRWLVA